jgi:protein-glutamine gamma-glutamyltransferase
LARTAVAVAAFAVLVTLAWGTLERTSLPAGDVVAMIGLAFAPAIAAARGLGRVRIVAVGLGAAIVAASFAFDVPLADARPRDGEHDFFGPVLDALRRGILDFYDTAIPFGRAGAPLMHGAVLLAIFAATAAAGALLALRKPIGASVILLAAVGIPATLAPEEYPLRTGALVLAGVLVALFLLRETVRPLLAARHGTIAAVALVGLATLASTSDAVAKGAFVDWQSWDPYDAPADPVGVRYVWNSHYLRIDFPEEPTVVFKVRVPGNQRNLYWRATTLDLYDGRGWREAIELGPESEADTIDRDGRLLPRAALNEDNWVRQEITIEAIRDTHLIGSNQPMRWQIPEDAAVQQAAGGDVVVVPDGLSRGQRYTVWSYVPEPKPARLAAAGTNYPEQIDRYLEAFDGVAVPRFDAGSRDALMSVVFDRYNDDFRVGTHRALYETARRVVGDVASPYAAALTLETWFRGRGGFTYDESPPFSGQLPALVSFVLEHKRGYCQHYAGAMATMLRLLGIPARVAAGFTSGTYNENAREWTVTDHNAHTWVEVFFPGFGWIPFDPTPGRGQLGARYSVASASFVTDAQDRAQLFGNATLEALRSQQGRPGLEGATRQPDPSGGAGVVRENAPSLVMLLALVVAGALILLTLVKAIRRAVRFASRDPRAQAAAVRRDLAAYLADQGIEISASATLPDIGQAVDREFGLDLDQFVLAATEARFAPPRAADPAVRRARRELRRTRRQLRRELSLGSRARGAVSLRSFGV